MPWSIFIWLLASVKPSLPNLDECISEAGMLIFKLSGVVSYHKPLTTIVKLGFHRDSAVKYFCLRQKVAVPICHMYICHSTTSTFPNASNPPKDINPRKEVQNQQNLLEVVFRRQRGLRDRKTHPANGSTGFTVEIHSRLTKSRPLTQVADSRSRLR